MGLLDKLLLGRSDDPGQARPTQLEELAPTPPTTPGPVSTEDPFREDGPGVRLRKDVPSGDPAGADEAALARYRYLLRTAPPEQVEQAHTEAFARLTPDQRRQALQQLAAVVPEHEQHGDDPRSLARTATRAEAARPGLLGQVLGGTLMSSIAAAYVGTVVAEAFLYAGQGDDGQWGLPDGPGGGDPQDAGHGDAGHDDSVWGTGPDDVSAGDPGDPGDLGDLGGADPGGGGPDA